MNSPWRETNAIFDIAFSCEIRPWTLLSVVEGAGEIIDCLRLFGLLEVG